MDFHVTGPAIYRINVPFVGTGITFNYLLYIHLLILKAHQCPSSQMCPCVLTVLILWVQFPEVQSLDQRVCTCLNLPGTNQTVCQNCMTIAWCRLSSLEVSPYPGQEHPCSPFTLNPQSSCGSNAPYLFI